MKVIWQAFLYCCLVATAAHCAELEVNPELKKRLSIHRLGSRLRRDPDSDTANSERLVGREVVGDTSLPRPGSETGVRTKRSKNSANQPRRQGCSLGTCSVHDLAHRLHILNSKLKTCNAPTSKLSPHGYGRRRRALPARRLALRLEQGELLRPVRSTADSQVHKLEALLRQT
ncbi:adrenomedullin a [Phyllopteryx taeniolatus]|uniref:adrenomedullin a n=1 Tax=Phyllopteryx taeniolatus TaxID=161469 RepID=UPI002AD430E0|nr:adrenomedullin a [Phyllopteryx taeniolatus]